MHLPVFNRTVRVLFVVWGTIVLFYKPGILFHTYGSLNGNSQAVQSRFHKTPGRFDLARNACRDAWSFPGYRSDIWYGDKDHFGVRWIPYKSAAAADTVMIPDAVRMYNPEEDHLNSTSSLPSTILSQMAPQLARKLRWKRGRQKNEDLAFARNKHVMLVGSSLDRNLLEYICESGDWEGTVTAAAEHRQYRVCRFPDIGLTLSLSFHFGMGSRGWYDEKHKAVTGGERMNAPFEPKMAEQFDILEKRFGTPDLVIFTSGLWDILWLRTRMVQMEPHKSWNAIQPMRFDHLHWHRARLAQAAQMIMSRFPKSYLVYRTTTESGKQRHKHDEEAQAIFQINESSRLIMKKLGVPILPWADIISGDYRDFVDDHHYGQATKANVLYFEMLLWHLKQISDVDSDISCWLDR